MQAVCASHAERSAERPEVPEAQPGKPADGCR